MKMSYAAELNSSTAVKNIILRQCIIENLPKSITEADGDRPELFASNRIEAFAYRLNSLSGQNGSAIMKSEDFLYRARPWREKCFSYSGTRTRQDRVSLHKSISGDGCAVVNHSPDV